MFNPMCLGRSLFPPLYMFVCNVTANRMVTDVTPQSTYSAMAAYKASSLFLACSAIFPVLGTVGVIEIDAFFCSVHGDRTSVSTSFSSETIPTRVECFVGFGV